MAGTCGDPFTSQRLHAHGLGGEVAKYCLRRAQWDVLCTLD